MFECLEGVEKKWGFDAKLSGTLVRQTLTGSLKLLNQSKDDAATWRARVTSKGGTTQAALEVFNKRNIEKIFEEALLAARKKAKQLAKT